MWWVLVCIAPPVAVVAYIAWEAMFDNFWGTGR